MRRGDVVAAVVVYVLPLLLVSGLLAVVGLGGLALALLGVEACVVALTVLAKRRPGRPVPSAPSTRPWLVPVGMVAVLAGVVGIAVVAASGG